MPTPRASRGSLSTETVYALGLPVDGPTRDIELLRTPSAIEGEGGAIREDVARAKGRMVQVRDQMAQLAADNGLKVSDALLPTPIVRDYKDGSAPVERGERGGTQSDTVARAIFNSGEVLLPTVTTSEATGAGSHGEGGDNLRMVAQNSIQWGKFEPAIRRWEQVLERPAPAPTKPDGKDGAHRLSSRFTEWMMGLPDGWITDVGLTRNEELKACGNGVVPQQAEMALRFLLDGVPVADGGGQVNLPTPTVSDTFTDGLSSTQQKDGSMHSVTLPQAVRWLNNESR